MYLHKAKLNSITKWALNPKLSGEGSHSNWVFEDPHHCTGMPALSGTSSENTSKKDKMGRKKKKPKQAAGNGNRTQQTAEPRS